MAQIAQLSPGVLTTETNLSTVVPSVLTTAGAYAGNFVWGPVNKVTPVGSEKILVNTFGTPDNNTAASFYTAASFLAYGNNLQVVRAANNQTLNADGNTAGPNIQVANESVFQYTLLSGAANTYGPFIARYPGALGNSLVVSVIDAGSGFANTSAMNTGWTYSIPNASNTTTTVAIGGYFSGLPGTSYYAGSLGSANDQIHVAVIDAGGLFTGQKGTVLETFPYLSKATDSVDATGASNYYKNAIFNNSRFIYAVDPVSYSTTSTGSGAWGQPTANVAFQTLTNVQTVAFSGGTDQQIQDGDVINAQANFSDPTQATISLLMTGPFTNTAVQTAAINLAASRKDCVAFVSPPQSAVINNVGNEQISVLSWINSLSALTGSTTGTYGFTDSGWKYLFDRYNNTYRWVPLNGDMAGLCVYTDTQNNPWWSPAGFNRGVLKNVIKLAWNPSKPQRDALYQAAVNPVASFPGQGTVLFGDKTMQTQPSAFDRINVRRLFIVLEQAIAKAAQYSLFEFNDAFTQAQFVALVTPFLNSVQAGRGIQAFQVVCDSTNNTPSVVNANQFVGDIYIQPARSINFIQLNFVAVGTGVSFSTVTTTTA